MINYHNPLRLFVLLDIDKPVVRSSLHFHPWRMTLPLSLPLEVISMFESLRQLSYGLGQRRVIIHHVTKTTNHNEAFYPRCFASNDHPPLRLGCSQPD